MLVALYWAWNYTTWMTNWFDPDTAPIRLVLVFVMAGSLLMAVAIPEGFGEHALLFACAYAGLQIGRNAFVVVVTPRGLFNQNFRQILAWSVLSAPLWVAGGIVDTEALRWVLWLSALGLDLAAPLVTYWLPGVGATAMSQWHIEGAHFGERFQLFVIIALGESIVLAGAAASDTGLSLEVVAALLLAFLSSTALWWLYFGQVPAGSRADPRGHRRGARPDRPRHLHLPAPPNRGGDRPRRGRRRARDRAPDGSLHDSGALVALGGPGLFLAGLMACAAGLARPRACRESWWSSRSSPPCRSPPGPTGWSCRECSPRCWERSWSPSSCAARPSRTAGQKSPLVAGLPDGRLVREAIPSGPVIVGACRPLRA